MQDREYGQTYSVLIEESGRAGRLHVLEAEDLGDARALDQALAALVHGDRGSTLAEVLDAHDVLVIAPPYGLDQRLRLVEDFRPLNERPYHLAPEQIGMEELPSVPASESYRSPRTAYFSIDSDERGDFAVSIRDGADEVILSLDTVAAAELVGEGFIRDPRRLEDYLEYGRFIGLFQFGDQLLPLDCQPREEIALIQSLRARAVELEAAVERRQAEHEALAADLQP